MPDKKLTDTEIVKALERLIELTSKDMLISNKGVTYGNVLDLINRLQAKLDEAEDTIQFADKELKKANAEIERLQAENEVLEARIGVYETCNARKDEAIRHLEAENEKLRNAYKQCAWERDIFAEDMKQEIKKDCSYLMLDIKAIKAEAYKEFAERLCEDRVSNDNTVILAKCLLKELAGEDNESKN